MQDLYHQQKYRNSGGWLTYYEGTVLLAIGAPAFLV